MMHQAGRVLFLAGIALLASGLSCGLADDKPAAPTPLVKTTHVYKTVGDVKVEADVYRPAGTDSRPVVVWIHGGALIVGGRSQVPKNILDLCTQERLIFVSLDYRLAPEVKLPEIATDIKDAFRWLNEQGPKLFQADTSRIVVAGGSAGGFLTMLSGVIVKPRPSALVAYWGYGDIDGPWTTTASKNHGAPIMVNDPQELLAGLPAGKIFTNTDDPAAGKARGMYYRYLRQTGTWSRGVTGIDATKEPGKLDPYCPVKNISADYPPILMVHGTEDTDVPYSCSVDMARQLAKYKVVHELVSVPNAEHGLRDGDPKLVAEANAKALDFIREHAKTKPPVASTAVADAEVAEQLAVISRVGRLGTGSAEARVARDALAQRDIRILPALLTAMDTSNSVAANWYRTIYEQIIARAQAQPDAVWPVEFLKGYVGEALRQGRPRRLALALIERLEPGFSEQWKPSRLADPEFRYEAVNLALAAGDRLVTAKDTEQAKAAYRRAFEAARDSAQVTQAADKLRSLNETTDAVAHLGLVVDWWLIGPFDAPEKTGFNTVFEPERKIDLQAKYAGQDGSQIAWIKHHAADSLGQLNLINAIAATREAVGYGYSEIEVPTGGAALLGCGADDNCAVWLNGEKVLAREQWLNGTRFDRFVTPVKLRTGRNTLLVKICQGPQHKDPEVPNNWSLQLRLCDGDGKGIAFKSALP